MDADRKRQAEAAAKKHSETVYYYHTDADKALSFQSFCEGVQWADTTPMPDSCDCKNNEKQVCDICQGLDAARRIAFKAITSEPYSSDGELGRRIENTREYECALDGIRHARRTQNAEVERLKKVVKNYSEMSLSYMAQIQELSSLLEKFKEMTEHALTLGHLGEGSTKGWAQGCLSDYEKLIGKK